MPLCLAAGAAVAVLAIESFTLAWTHSIEKIRWEEDWHIQGDRLELVEARIRGTGAGMEPPPGARLENGVWRYQPTLPAQRHLHLAQATGLPPFLLCAQGRCQRLDELLPDTQGEPVELSPCSAAITSSASVPAILRQESVGRRNTPGG